jgi:hypothetical protein
MAPEGGLCASSSAPPAYMPHVIQDHNKDYCLLADLENYECEICKVEKKPGHA